MAAFPGDFKLQLERSMVSFNFDSAYLSLLDAQAETDLLCLNNSIQSVLENCDREKVLRAIAVANSLHDYYATLGARLQQRRSTDIV